MQRSYKRKVPALFLSPHAVAKGFGLAEILVATTVFVIAFFLLLGVLTSSATAIQQSQEEVLAVELADQIVESQRALPFSALASFSSHQDASYQSNGNNVTLRLLYDVTVTSTPAVSPTYRDILVNVTWTSMGIARSLALETGATK